MAKLVRIGETQASRRRVYFDCRQTDGVTPSTVEAGGQPQISLDGAAWVGAGDIGVLTAIGNGRYYADLAPSSVSAAGVQIETRYKSGTCVETPGDSYQVIGFDPATPQGSGARTVTITVTDGSSNPLQAALVRMTAGVEFYLGVTNSSGQVVFNVDDNTWTISITLAGYSFAGTTLVVAGAVTQSYALTQLALTPSVAGTTTGYFYVYDQFGAILAGATVSCNVLRDDVTTGFAWDTALDPVTSDVNGLVQFPNLVKGAVYQFQRGTGKLYTMTIPETAGSTYALPSIVGTP